MGEVNVSVDAVSDGVRGDGDGEVVPRRGKRVMGQPEEVRRVKRRRRRESVGPGWWWWEMVRVSMLVVVGLIGAGDLPRRQRHGDHGANSGDGGIYRRRLWRRVGVVGALLDEREEELAAVGRRQVTSTTVHGGGWRRGEGEVAVLGCRLKGKREA